jgi:hypothetical protein
VGDRPAWSGADHGSSATAASRSGRNDSAHPVGYRALLRDPDGHTLERSYGQEVARTVAAVAG